MKIVFNLGGIYSVAEGLRYFYIKILLGYLNVLDF